MFTLCWSPKGGSGTTVVAASLALLSARERPTVLIDLGGDAPAALGLGSAGEPGVVDWLGAPHADADALFRLATPCGEQLGLIGLGSGPTGRTTTPSDWERLASACRDRHGIDVIVDAGPSVPPLAAHQLAMRSLLVVRPCYLALRRAVQRVESPTGIVIVSEPGRALGVNDVERSLSLPVLAEIPWDPSIARAVDAGLLAVRLPQTISRPLRRLTTGTPA